MALRFNGFVLDPAGQRCDRGERPCAELNAVGPRFEYYGAVAHYLGQLARLLGREAEARRYFTQALRINARLDMPAQLRKTERELAALRACRACCACGERAHRTAPRMRQLFDDSCRRICHPRGSTPEIAFPWRRRAVSM